MATQWFRRPKPGLTLAERQALPKTHKNARFTQTELYCLDHSEEYKDLAPRDALKLADSKRWYGDAIFIISMDRQGFIEHIKSTPYFDWSDRLAPAK